MLVLDESDRMVEMGFAADLRRILKMLPETRQTLMFTGTMPPELNRVAKEALVEPIRIDIGGGTKPAPGLTQAIYPVPRDLKSELLVEMLSRQDVQSVIVFTRTREVADRLARQLHKVGYAVDTLHAKLSQSERERALSDLRRGKLQIAVATDNAGRAVDLDGISHVINYDVPPVPEDYVHRIRREGPGGGNGDAFTLMSPEEQKEVAVIERFLGRTVARVMLPDFDYRMRPAEIQQAVSYRDGGRTDGPPAKPTPAPSRPSATATVARPARPTARPGKHAPKVLPKRSGKR
jgi:ATP-dependent RNA helicase RhlE